MPVPGVSSSLHVVGIKFLSPGTTSTLTKMQSTVKCVLSLENYFLFRLLLCITIYTIIVLYPFENITSIFKLVTSNRFKYLNELEKWKEVSLSAKRFCSQTPSHSLCWKTLMCSILYMLFSSFSAVNKCSVSLASQSYSSGKSEIISYTLVPFTFFMHIWKGVQLVAMSSIPLNMALLK